MKRLDKAIADICEVKMAGAWTWRDFETFSKPRAKSIAAILNAVQSGELVLAALASHEGENE